MKATQRKPCPIDRKRALLEEQDFVCAYCAIPFGSVIRSTRGRLRVSSVQFDHAIPFAYLNSNPISNWVAACNFCNQMKSGDVYESWAQIRDYIEVRWRIKHMSVAWLAPISSEEDPERWAVKFGTYLAGMPRGLAATISFVKPWSAKDRRKRVA